MSDSTCSTVDRYNLFDFHFALERVTLTLHELGDCLK